MKLSLRVWLVIFACSPLASGRAAAEPKAVQIPLPAEPSVNAETVDWVDALWERIEQLRPILMSSLAASRREHDKGLVRCFDRAVAGLNSAQRQLGYHADLRDGAQQEGERARQTRALRLLSARVDELALSVETCFTDGIAVKHDQTVVEVIVEQPRR